MIAFAGLATLAGIGLLFLSMRRHHHDWIGRLPTRSMQLTLRTGGVLVLGLALVLSSAPSGWGYGLVVWCGSLGAAAAGVVMADVHRVRLLRWMGVRPS